MTDRDPTLDDAERPQPRSRLIVALPLVLFAALAAFPGAFPRSGSTAARSAASAFAERRNSRTLRDAYG